METDNRIGTESHNWHRIKRSDGKMGGVKGNRNGVRKGYREKRTEHR